MNKAQISVLLIAAAAIFLVNLPGAIPSSYFYKGVQHPVGSDTVSVYSTGANSEAPAVPIIKVPANPNEASVNTGQFVAVYVRNDYRDGDVNRIPRVTLSILFGFALLYRIVSWVTHRRPAQHL